MLPVQNVAATVLASVIRRQPPSPARTTFAWQVAVGPALARVTTVDLVDRVLQVTPKDARWAREIARSADTILARVQALIGSAAVTGLRVLDAPPASHLAPRG